MRAGWQIEDSCTCADPRFMWECGPFDETCTAHPRLLGEVLRGLNEWLDATPEHPTDETERRLQRVASALLSLTVQHWRHEAPGPDPSPTGSCGSCGGTGEVFHGFAIEGGPIFDGQCGCDTPFCGGCCGAWPCDDIKTVASALGIRAEPRDRVTCPDEIHGADGGPCPTCGWDSHPIPSTPAPLSPPWESTTDAQEG
jgi:hypothetical protein